MFVRVCAVYSIYASVCVCECMRRCGMGPDGGRGGRGGRGWIIEVELRAVTTAGVQTEDGSLRLKTGVMTSSSTVPPKALHSLFGGE